jgi:putative ABC transport system permease protein
VTTVVLGAGGNGDVPAPVPAAPAAAAMVPRSRLRAIDVLGVGSVGMRTRRLRTALTALGIAIGIAALVAVMGISASSRADLIAQINALGTDKLEVRAGRSFLGEEASLPEDAAAMIRHIGPVEAASALTAVDATVRRSPYIPESETGGIGVSATDTNLPATVRATLADGRFLDEATGQLPAVVLGSAAAERLGIDDLDGQPMVWIGGQWFVVIGILDPVPLQGNLDSGAFIGYDIAEALFDTERNPTSIQVRTDPEYVEEVREVLAATANPEAPNEVDVSRPSDTVEAREAVDDSLTALLLGLGAVALLVGGIGIANVMVISVLERRTEIGVRRALGATRGHVRIQFLVEAVLLAGLGGLVGTALGVAVTAGYARYEDIVLSVPATSIAAGIGAALAVGALAGLSPAHRAARLAPADAIRTG